MNPAAAFFLLALALQAAFTASVVLIVRWRVPRRLRAYRLIAPAAVPVLLFALVAFSYLAASADAGLAYDAGAGETLARFAVAYLVLWLAGVLFAGLLIRVAARLR